MWLLFCFCFKWNEIFTEVKLEEKMPVGLENDESLKDKKEG